MKRILIVDDDVAVTNYFRIFLMQTGIFETRVVNDSREVLGLLERESFDIMLLDMDMPHVSGMEILKSLRSRGDNIPVIVLTGVSDVEIAVKAMKNQAFDYLVKPVDEEKLLEVIDKALEHSDLQESIENLPRNLTRETLQHEEAFEQFPTQDPEVIRLFHQAERLAASDLSIFIWGESGTGKKNLAEAIHRASPRSNRPFVAIEADGTDPGEFPSLFFGVEKEVDGRRETEPGVVEQADHGTLFLDNIHALTRPMQVRLKRLIQTGEYHRENSARIRRVDVRLIVSSTQDLTKPEFKDRFSRDLLYHLMVNSIRIPPLRERVEDIPLLAEYFLERENRRLGRKIKGFSSDYLGFLKRYPYPENVRELHAVIAGSVANCDGDIIRIEHLPAYIHETGIVRLPSGKRAFHPTALAQVVKEYVLKTLHHFGDDRERAAAALEISPDELEKILNS